MFLNNAEFKYAVDTLNKHNLKVELNPLDDTFELYHNDIQLIYDIKDIAELMTGIIAFDFGVKHGKELAEAQVQPISPIMETKVEVQEVKNNKRYFAVKKDEYNSDDRAILIMFDGLQGHYVYRDGRVEKSVYVLEHYLENSDGYFTEVFLTEGDEYYSNYSTGFQDSTIFVVKNKNGELHTLSDQGETMRIFANIDDHVEKGRWIKVEF